MEESNNSTRNTTDPYFPTVALLESTSYPSLISFPQEEYILPGTRISTPFPLPLLQAPYELFPHTSWHEENLDIILMDHLKDDSHNCEKSPELEHNSKLLDVYNRLESEVSHSLAPNTIPWLPYTELPLIDQLASEAHTLMDKNMKTRMSIVPLSSHTLYSYYDYHYYRYPRTKTKKNVKKACNDCRRLHLACNVKRPCDPCIRKDRTCTDTESRPRGRPRCCDHSSVVHEYIQSSATHPSLKNSSDHVTC
jgi:hypothetical protein